MAARICSLGGAMSIPRVFVSITALTIVVLAQAPAKAADLQIFASRAVATVIEKVGPEFEKSTGNRLRVIMGLCSELVARINANEPFDIIAVPPPVLDNLIKSGKVIADSKTILLRSANGVLIRAGAPKPDISSVEAFKRTLLAAKSIAYLPVPGVPQLIERLGLKDAIAAKVTMPTSDIVGDLVAKGEVELAITAITQGYTTPGAEVAGPLPPGLQFYVSFAGAVGSKSLAPADSRALLNFLKSPAVAPVIKEQGMEPI
jgi:molybdate transport system substrate-binding protein